MPMGTFLQINVVQESKSLGSEVRLKTIKCKLAILGQTFFHSCIKNSGKPSKKKVCNIVLLEMSLFDKAGVHSGRGGGYII